VRVLVLLALAGCLLPDTPAAPSPVVDPDVAELVHGWKVTAHVIGTKTTLSEQDAAGMHGRVVEVRAAGYTTPWHGTCEHAAREKQQSSLVEITARLKEFGLAKDVTEYRLGCTDPKVPPLTIYLTGKRAMTCFGGVCYLLER
jgi:hypothetical protein